MACLLCTSDGWGAAQHSAYPVVWLCDSIAGGDELAAFKQEIAAIDAEAAAAITVDNASAPPQQDTHEKSFVDDDGTAYVWDAILGRYVAKAEDAAATKQGDLPTNEQEQSAYNVQEMTYEADEETLPSLEEAKSAVEAEKLEMEMGEGVRICTVLLLFLCFELLTACCAYNQFNNSALQLLLWIVLILPQLWSVQW